MSGQHTIFRRLRALSERLREFVEALGLEKPPLPIAALHRRICKIAGERRENIPTDKAVYRIVRGLPKDLLTRAMKERRPYGDVLWSVSKTNVKETLVRRVIQEAQAQMRPEIFDRSTVCWSLTGFSYEVQINVGRFHLEREIEAQKRRGHIVSGWDDEVLNAIVRNGYSEKQGARRMRNTARETVHEAIRDALLRGREAGGQLDYNGQSKTFFLNRQR